MYEPVACLLTLGLSMLDTKGISLVLRSFHVSVSVSVFCLFSFLSLGPCSSISFRGSSTPSLVRIPRSVRVLLGGVFTPPRTKDQNHGNQKDGDVRTRGPEGRREREHICVRRSSKQGQKREKNRQSLKGEACPWRLALGGIQDPGSRHDTLTFC